MAKFIIEGNQELKGEIKISGAKNAALKIIPAAILSDDESIIENVPDIADINKMIEILRSIGAEIDFKDNILRINPSTIKTFKPDESLVKKLRGSIVLAGPLLARFGEVMLFQPGGCLIGARPIDDHLDMFSQLGVKIEKNDRYYHLKGKPQANEVILGKMSVTATENAIMASVLSHGTTKIHVAACEPEIADLINFLNKMGAKISGANTHDITIEGVERLHGTTHAILPDRIEAGTYLIAAIATNSELKIGPVNPYHMSIVLKKLKDAKANFEIISENNENFIVTKKHNGLISVDVDTRTFPGFSTDLQSPFAVLMTQAKGESTLFETLFEGRFLFIDDLITMGAKSEILSPHIVKIQGPVKLKGTSIMSRDLRGGAALIIAGLVADGQTILEDNGYIERGYNKMDEKLRAVGANIKRVE